MWERKRKKLFVRHRIEVIKSGLCSLMYSHFFRMYVNNRLYSENFQMTLITKLIRNDENSNIFYFTSAMRIKFVLQKHLISHVLYLTDVSKNKYFYCLQPLITFPLSVWIRQSNYIDDHLSSHSRNKNNVFHSHSRIKMKKYTYNISISIKFINMRILQKYFRICWGIWSEMFTICYFQAHLNCVCVCFFSNQSKFFDLL